MSSKVINPNNQEELDEWLKPEIMLFTIKFSRTYHVLSEEHGFRVWDRRYKQFTGDHRVIGACGKKYYVKLKPAIFTRVDKRDIRKVICPFCEKEITGKLNIRSEGYKRWYADRQRAIKLGRRVFEDGTEYPEPAL